MAKLPYSTIASLDGYVEDQQGAFEWADPDEDVHTLNLVNDLERPGTYLYGRRMYQTMLLWETAHTMPNEPSCFRDYTEMTVGGADLAGQAIGAGLVDELHLFAVPSLSERANDRYPMAATSITNFSICGASVAALSSLRTVSSPDAWS